MVSHWAKLLQILPARWGQQRNKEAVLCDRSNPSMSMPVLGQATLPFPSLSASHKVLRFCCPSAPKPVDTAQNQLFLAALCKPRLPGGKAQ